MTCPWHLPLPFLSKPASISHSPYTARKDTKPGVQGSLTPVNQSVQRASSVSSLINPEWFPKESVELFWIYTWCNENWNPRSKGTNFNREVTPNLHKEQWRTEAESQVLLIALGPGQHIL